ncbi:MAG: acylneuraminate cytidylyltransferase family protein [Gammaproteobacteria bacterium]|nr:MAG: acylneuraminate cytidylyltransferase family protein [Gammaproteobacteria bacterium]
MQDQAFKLVALLPIKGHSERVPGKNFRTIAGQPLYRWTLDTLLSLPEVERVIVNTDARRELKESGLKEEGFGGRVLIRDRKPQLCGDFVSMNRVLADDIEAVAADIYLMTHTTNPCLSAATIRRAIAAFRDARAKGKADSLFTVTRIQTRFYRADGSPVNHDPDNLVRTQDLEPWFEENSCLYIFSRESFRATGSRIGRQPMLFETTKVESVDIDDADDWTIAEALLRYRQGKGSA